MPNNKPITLSNNDCQNINDPGIKQLMQTLLEAELLAPRLDAFYALAQRCIALLHRDGNSEQKLLLAELGNRAEAMVMAIIGSKDPSYIKEQMALGAEKRQRKPDCKEQDLLWLPEEERVADQADNVVYLETAKEREAYRILLAEDGLIKKLSFSRSPSGGSYELRPFDTSAHFGHGEPGNALLVITPAGDLFAGSTKDCAFYHSSFTGSEPLFFAGKFKVDMGKIRLLDNRSGHYRTPPEALDKALHFIGENYFIPKESLIRKQRIVYNPQTNEGQITQAVYTFAGGVSDGYPAVNLQLTHYDAIISGAGPSGLTAAIELADLGKSVLLVDKRVEAYLRPQIVYLTKGSRNYLTSLLIGEKTPEDQRFLDHLAISWGTGIKDIERFLHNQLMKRALLPGAKVQFLRQHSIAEVNLEAGRLIARPDSQPDFLWKELSFKTLIGADGTNHHLTDVVNASSQNPIRYLTEDDATHKIYTPRNWRNASLYAVLRRKDGKPFTFPFIQFIALPGAKTTEDEPPFAYCLYYLMFAHKYKEVTNAKFNAALELPEYLYNKLLNKEISREEAIAEVIRYIETGLFGRMAREGLHPEEFEVVCTNPSRKYGPAKDRVKFFTFNTKIACASKAYQQSNSGNSLILVGDAVRRPFFHISHGVNDGLYSASLLAKLMCRPQRMSLEDYDKQLRERSNQISDMTEELGTHVTNYDKRWEESKEFEAFRLQSCTKYQPNPECHSDTSESTQFSHPSL